MNLRGAALLPQALFLPVRPGVYSALILPPYPFPWETSLFEEQILGFLLKFQYSKHPEGKEKVSLQSPLCSSGPLPSKRGIISKLTVGKPAWLQNTQE